MTNEKDQAVKWEYTDITKLINNTKDSDAFDAKMNEMGEQGWEAYSVIYRDSRWVVFFKRKK